MISFSDILGQDAAIDTLSRAYQTDRLPHGLIFAGPTGVGKATTAKALAALFLCQNPRNLPQSSGSPAGRPREGAPLPSPCGQCNSCVALEANTHPDYHVVTRQLIRYHDKTGKSKGIDLSIDVIRKELVNPAGLKAALGHGKVFIVEEADTMNAQAQNAMLKTLEEPAGPTLIILLTDQPGALLPTIRSRSQLIPFAPLDPDVILQKLQTYFSDARQSQDVSPDSSDIATATTIAEGSLGNALQWLQDGVIPRARHLMSSLDEILAGRPPDALEAWFKTSAEAYAEKQIEKDALGSKDQATRTGYALYLHLAASHLRNRMSNSSSPEELERICSAIDAIAKAEQYLWANVNTSLVFQQLTLAWEMHLAATK
ncbi:MAG TPA: hypothetical protein VF669_01255 [Tepidisphaeraceae bacterium]|jgi:DNA polymerase-3 subunit delta'